MYSNLFKYIYKIIKKLNIHIFISILYIFKIKKYSFYLINN